MAREIHDDLKVTDHTWKLTGETGSLRYMAPEVADDKPYGECHNKILLVVLFNYIGVMFCESLFDDVALCHDLMCCLFLSYVLRYLFKLFFRLLVVL